MAADKHLSGCSSGFVFVLCPSEQLTGEWKVAECFKFACSLTTARVTRYSLPFWDLEASQGRQPSSKVHVQNTQ